MKFLFSILYVIGLYGAYMAGFLYLRNRSATLRFPRITVLLFFMSAVPSTLQFIFPALLTTLQRDPVRFFHGEWSHLCLCRMEALPELFSIGSVFCSLGPSPNNCGIARRCCFCSLSEALSVKSWLSPGNPSVLATPWAISVWLPALLCLFSSGLHNCPQESHRSLLLLRI